LKYKNTREITKRKLTGKMGIDGEVWLLDDQQIVEMSEAEKKKNVFEKDKPENTSTVLHMKYILSKQILKIINNYHNFYIHIKSSQICHQRARGIN
jgi:ligand-binding sensor domain-containing protein